ncbi:hypothetical protein GCM10007304_11580 [Rhodococcoides trifolii]|uniref:Uncharacterized protein n=1 Tax=Rhodococcoides trifolii TaxID=908250 RepID=A0A917CV92_9NOCA|nr:hypothetical protein GCM10007304_11580 [Rhodococcus trifolii]
MFSSNPTAFQIAQEPEEYLGREIAIDWYTAGVLSSVETVETYGPPQIRLVLRDASSGRSVDFELDLNQAVRVRD